MRVPSAVPKQHLLGVLHVWINLTVFEEPARVEGMCVWVHRFVMKYRPFRYSVGCQKQSTKVVCIPCVGYDGRASGGELSLVHIIFHQPICAP